MSSRADGGDLARLMVPLSAPTDIGASRVCSIHGCKKGAQPGQARGDHSLEQWRSRILAPPIRSAGYPSYVGRSSSPAVVALCPSPYLYLKLHQYSWTSLCETHSAHALGHGAARDSSWTRLADQLGSLVHSVCTMDQELVAVGSQSDVCGARNPLM
jgi:hypothetical protein